MLYMRTLYLCLIFFCVQLYAYNPIHVLFVMDKFPCDTKTVIINQALGLMQNGFRVSILAKKKCTSSNPILQNFLKDSVHWGSITNFDLHDVDVIICQYGSLGKECAKYFKKNKNVRIVTFLRGSDITSTSETRTGEYDTLFAVGDLFLPVCSYYAYLLENLGCNPRKILVQPSGINCNMFNFRKKIPHLSLESDTQDPIRIISVGRLVEKKGIEDAIKAVAILIHEGYNIEYTLVGEGKQRDMLLALTQELNISDKVHIIGHKPNDKIAHLLSKSHIFILPSVTSANGSQEGIPNVLKEAMAIGLPVISTYHAGIRELIKHEESGLLVPERDVCTLVKNIKYLIHNPEKWVSMISLARKTVESLYDIKDLNTLLAKRIKLLMQTSRHTIDHPPRRAHY